MNRKLAEYEVDAIKRGYSFECPCGELHKSHQSAVSCRKCREYLIDYNDRELPVDLRSFL